MAGVADSAFRRLCRRFGAGLLYTEVISAEGLRRLGRKSFDRCRFEYEERPIAIQLFGKDPSQFTDAAGLLEERYYPNLIDINCGCPAKKFVSREVGGWLMQDPDKIGRLVEGARQGCSQPLSVKLRAGYRASEETAPLAARAAEQAGASLVAIHARYVRCSRGTVADWEVIARVKDAVSHIPVVGNGDVFSAADARRMMGSTGCDRVMIGRGACGRPWIFRAVLEELLGKPPASSPSPRERINILLEHYRLMLESLSEPRAVQQMRKHLSWYTHGLPGSAKLRGSAMTIDDLPTVLQMLTDYRDHRLPHTLTEADEFDGLSLMPAQEY